MRTPPTHPPDSKRKINKLLQTIFFRTELQKLFILQFFFLFWFWHYHRLFCLFAYFFFIYVCFVSFYYFFFFFFIFRILFLYIPHLKTINGTNPQTHQWYVCCNSIGGQSFIPQMIWTVQLNIYICICIMKKNYT